MPSDDPAFSKSVRVMRNGRWFIMKTVGVAIDFVTYTLDEPELAKPHWKNARRALYAAYPDDATLPGIDLINAAEEALQAAIREERWPT